MRVIGWVGYILFALLALYGLRSFFTYAQGVYHETLLPRPTAAIAAPVPPAFDAVGVITFYRQTNGAKPWLLYASERGVAAKALSCAACTTGLISDYGGRAVRVTGTLVAEHVDVARIDAAPSDGRIAVFGARMGETASASGISLTPRTAGGGADDALLWADVEDGGVTTQVFFKQGKIVEVGSRAVSLLYARDGTYRFAVIGEQP